MTNKVERCRMMYNCSVTIITTADGKKTEITRAGVLTVSSSVTSVTYEEEDAHVCVRLENGVVMIERTGGYTLFLRLVKGELTEGTIGISSSQGTVQTKTYRIAYVKKENAFELSLHYDLLFGEERQNIKIRLYAQEI